MARVVNWEFLIDERRPENRTSLWSYLLTAFLLDISPLISSTFLSFIDQIILKCYEGMLYCLCVFNFRKKCCIFSIFLFFVKKYCYVLRVFPFVRKCCISPNMSVKIFVKEWCTFFVCQSKDFINECCIFYVCLCQILLNNVASSTYVCVKLC